MWERCRELVEAAGRRSSSTGPSPSAARRAGARWRSRRPPTAIGPHPCTHVVSTMPLADLVRVMDPPPPADVRAAADALRYRDFLTVALIVPRTPRSPTTGSTCTPGGPGRADPELRVVVAGHGQGPHLPRARVLRQRGRRPGELPDDELVALGHPRDRGARAARPASSRPGTSCGCRRPTRLRRGVRGNVAVLRGWLAAHVPNVHPVGRNGMHRYNNQDHSMLTAMLAVENIVGNATHDVWSVNVEGDYHEEGGGTGGAGRALPDPPPRGRGGAPGAPGGAPPAAPTGAGGAPGRRRGPPGGPPLRVAPACRPRAGGGAVAVAAFSSPPSTRPAPRSGHARPQQGDVHVGQHAAAVGAERPGRLVERRGDPRQAARSETARARGSARRRRPARARSR